MRWWQLLITLQNLQKVTDQKIIFNLHSGPGRKTRDLLYLSWNNLLQGQYIQFRIQISVTILWCEVAQWCTILYPMDCSLSGSSVHGIFQARILEWVAISFSRGSSQTRDQTRVSHIVGSATREALYRLYYKELQNECNTQPWRLFILNLNGWENLETEWQAPGVNSNESTYIILPHNILPPFSANKHFLLPSEETSLLLFREPKQFLKRTFACTQIPALLKATLLPVIAFRPT